MLEPVGRLQDGHSSLRGRVRPILFNPRILAAVQLLGLLGLGVFKMPLN